MDTDLPTKYLIKGISAFLYRMCFVHISIRRDQRVLESLVYLASNFLDSRPPMRVFEGSPGTKGGSQRRPVNCSDQ